MVVAYHKNSLNPQITHSNLQGDMIFFIIKRLFYVSPSQFCDGFCFSNIQCVTGFRFIHPQMLTGFVFQSRSVTGFGGPCRPKTLAKKMIKTWIWRNWVTHPKPHTCDQESHYQTGCPSVGCCWLPSCCESWGATKTRGKLCPLALGALQGSAGAFSGSKPARKNRLNNSLLETL